VKWLLAGPYMRDWLSRNRISIGLLPIRCSRPTGCPLSVAVSYLYVGERCRRIFAASIRPAVRFFPGTRGADQPEYRARTWHSV